MENINNKFSGNLVQNCQQKSISTELITLVSMLIKGNNISNYTSFTTIQLYKCTNFNV